MPGNKLFNLIEQKKIVIKFERAINDLRKGLPILFNKTTLVLASESLERPMLDTLHQHRKTILISKNRAEKIGIKTDLSIGIDVDIVSLEYINQITIDKNFKLEDANYKSGRDYKEILEILKLAKLVPAALIIKNSQYNADIINIDSSDIESYKMQRNDSLNNLFTAPLNLKDAKEACITTFRPTIGGRDHYAIIVGDPSSVDVPLVRIHSSCYTGDLLGSLDCDCGEQLRDSLKLIAKSKEKAGVVVYLMQEGRGIGLTNKLRTYVLQNKGLDTVDANLALGFDDDERSFDIAAKILKSLEISKIKLITNNPKKVSSLASEGIEVIGTVPIHTDSAKTSKYFATKVEKLGHKTPKP
ncbi:MAG: GTP cyclohydrolase II [Rickettsiales bacterium]